MDQYNQGVLAQTLRRSCDYHKSRLKASGFDDLAEGDCTEEMGDITSIGEQYITNQEQKSSAPLWLSGIGAALAAALITYLLTKPDKLPEQPQSTLGVGLEVEPGGALP